MDSDLQTRIRIMEDREEIRMLLADYCWYATKAEWEKLVALFAEGGTLHIALPGGGARHWNGREEILQSVTALNLPVIPLLHNEVIKVDGDRAESRCTMHTPLGPDSSSNGFVGHYHDQLAKVNGKWRFTARHFEPQLGNY
jgi:hypothetical protein